MPARRSIPDAPRRPGREFDEGVKEVVETMSGRRPGVTPIVQLASTATSAAELNAKINEIIVRLQQ